MSEETKLLKAVKFMPNAIKLLKNYQIYFLSNQAI